MSYETKNIRNICLLGHGNSGKTSLAESMLFTTGAIDRQGKVSDGNTVCDYDAEEIKRQITISASVAPVEFGGCKINVLDCPGYFDFVGEALAAIRAVEAGVILCSAKDGISVGAERSWKYLKAANVPVAFCISKCDEEHGDYYAVLDALKAKYGSIVCAVTVPMSDGTGVIDVVHNVAYQTKGGKTSKVAVPASDAGKVEELREALMETAAGATEELMEKFFENMELSEEDTIEGLRIGLRERSVVPVFASAAMSNIGTEALLQGIVDYVSNPAEMDGIDPAGTTVGFVFKTISDQFGKYSFVKIMQGKITADMSLRDVRTSSTDKLGRLYTVCGKKTTEVKEACCGDIVAVGKMDWKTGDTVCDPKNEVELPAIELPEPCYSMAISPKTKGQDDKVAGGLARLNEEDISFHLVNNAETHQMVISGEGDIQVDVLCAKLKSRFGVETELKPARVPYREKIKGKVEAHGRHKKQSGGSGQFGDVWIRFEPQDEQDDMIFAEEVFGGSVPKNFFPSVEKGLRNAVVKGVLAGYPLVGLKATLYDGSYHPVDSNDMAFQTAARLAYQDGIPKAKPTILEPIGLLQVTIPDANLGDIMSDISSKRRGTVLGMTAEDGMQTVEAEVPMAEMSSYTIDLRSMTQGRGSFTCKFIRYEEAPGNVQQKVIEEAKAAEDKE
ncbi:MAG: elongation factor G [Candidatus Limivicinus sp.]|nr:elongation factor G [Candidatus Limivicinus sp.]MDY5083976.1 elongation factor G [Candidatus Limivicinus sp.]